MAKKKKVTGLIKLQIAAGAATPAPPVGPALGQHGVNIAAVCRSIINQVRYMVSENTGASIRSIDVCVDSMNL